MWRRRVGECSTRRCTNVHIGTVLEQGGGSHVFVQCAKEAVKVTTIGYAGCFQFTQWNGFEAWTSGPHPVSFWIVFKSGSTNFIGGQETPVHRMFHFAGVVNTRDSQDVAGENLNWTCMPTGIHKHSLNDCIYFNIAFFVSCVCHDLQGFRLTRTFWVCASRRTFRQW